MRVGRIWRLVGVSDEGLVVRRVRFGVLDASRYVVGFIGVGGDNDGTFDFRVLGEALTIGFGGVVPHNLLQLLKPAFFTNFQPYMNRFTSIKSSRNAITCIYPTKHHFVVNSDIGYLECIDCWSKPGTCPYYFIERRVKQQQERLCRVEWLRYTKTRMLKTIPSPVHPYSLPSRRVAIPNITPRYTIFSHFHSAHQAQNHPRLSFLFDIFSLPFISAWTSLSFFSALSRASMLAFIILP